MKRKSDSEEILELLIAYNPDDKSEDELKKDARVIAQSNALNRLERSRTHKHVTSERHGNWFLDMMRPPRAEISVVDRQTRAIVRLAARSLFVALLIGLIQILIFYKPC